MRGLRDFLKVGLRAKILILSKKCHGICKSKGFELFLDWGQQHFLSINISVALFEGPALFKILVYFFGMGVFLKIFQFFIMLYFKDQGIF